MTPADGVEPSPSQELPPCRRHHISVIATTSLGPQGPSCHRLLPVPPPFLHTTSSHSLGGGGLLLHRWWSAPIQVPCHPSPSTSCLHLRFLLPRQLGAVLYTETVTLCFLSLFLDALETSKHAHRMCGLASCTVFRESSSEP